MYYDKKDLPAVARTTTLNEELGQIEYIFSDKTGTLTQNVMEFRKCSIGGQTYGDIVDVDGMTHSKTVDLSHNDYAEDAFQFYDQTLVDAIKAGDPDSSEFFRLIAICHTVMSDEPEEGKLTYQAQSPDENALVTAARNFGFVFKSRTFDTITIIEMGKPVEYKVLAILDFDNVRKRMSVIVQNPDGKITLYCKGADSMIFERISATSRENLYNKTLEQLDIFAASGLRTLCLSLKHLDQQTYNVWKEAHTAASTALEDRDDKLSAVYEEIERDMTLLGATAIEDKLQDGVPETIANLSKANIKIWVLTGDKQETAINIGYSCNMLTEEMKDVFIVDGHSSEEVLNEIENALKDVQQKSPNLTAENSREENTRVSHNRSNGNGDVVTMNSYDDDKYGLVINGNSLVHALSADMESKFLELASLCTAVICCRVTPLQKAKVVDLVKRNKKAVTLAIGDGANDVSMIKAAHIGVGISGEEGTQAVLSSDFAFGQFRYLERLLLVHGRWSYVRMCKFFGFFFYKNFAFTLVHFWYSFFSGLTAQDVSETYSVRYPRLYLPGQKNELFNVKIFLKSLVRGIVVSLILFFVPYFVFLEGVDVTGIDAASRESVSVTIATSLIIVVTLQAALETTFWTPINHFFIWGSIVAFFIFTFGIYSDGLFQLLPSQFPFVGSARISYSFSTLWLTVILTSAICILPVVVYRVLYYNFRPTYAQEILKLQVKEKNEEKRKRVKSSESIASEIQNRLQRLKPKRKGSVRPKSGYAFSHEQGFGELISSGRMSSRRRKRAEEQAAKETAPVPKLQSETPSTSSATGTYKTIAND